MRVLLSAYACEPNKGSEPGVGWSWAVELSKTHEVWVATRDNNQPTIEQYFSQYPEYKNDNLHFIYIGLPRKLTFWKKGRRGMRLYYMLWQKTAVKIAKKWHDRIHFDVVHHVTFVSYTQHTYMYKLGIPLIFGPVSGGENIPCNIAIKMNKKEQLIEKVRELSQYTALLASSTKKTMDAAKCIFVATAETKARIPDKFQHKTVVFPAIGLDSIHNYDMTKNNEKICIIMTGRLIYWKAFDIGLKAFLRIVEKYPNTELHILGEGNKKEELKKLSGYYLNKQIFFENPVSHDDIYDFYSRYDLFLNTTLRDSGCMAMMEAMSVGLPCIAIPCGGPGVLLDEFEIARISANSYQDAISNTANKLEFFIQNMEAVRQLGKAQKQFAESKLLMSEKCKIVEKYYEK